MRRSIRASAIIDPVSARTAQTTGGHRSCPNERTDSPTIGTSARTATASKARDAMATAHRRQDHNAWCGWCGCSATSVAAPGLRRLAVGDAVGIASAEFRHVEDDHRPDR